MSTPTVAAVVLTRDRREMLADCLRALDAQTRRPDVVFVVDNASSDGTPEYVREHHPGAELIRLEENSGAAGGYRAALQAAHARGYDWIWTLDDDAIAAPDALERLIEAAAVRVPGQPAPAVLASRVVWTDGSLHAMNVPRPDARDPRLAFEIARAGLAPIRSCSWVSALFASSAIDRHGLPHADFFYWSDDAEYTARLLQDGIGYYVQASVVEHRTATQGLPIDRGGASMYYEFRNKLWMVRSGPWSPVEKLRLATEVQADLRRYLRESRFSRDALATAARGVAHGLRGRRASP
jgi:rhamnopyranosyl-N-acetylglucosaminyl-diphospho-decaprenol beta-1,3/1,4-galactofuranosyltransferase